MYNIFIGGTEFPVPPASINLTVNNKNEVVTLISEGEINIIKKPGLTDLEFELLLPNSKYPFANYNGGFKDASFFLDVLEKIKLSEDPTSFVLTRSKPNGQLMYDTNMTVSLEGYQIIEDVEELGFDVKVVIPMKQYKEYGTKKLVVQQNATAQSKKKVSVEKQRATTGKVTPSVYTVKTGDNLYAIAKKYLGDGNKASELATLNRLSNPALIRPGQKIKLK